MTMEMLAKKLLPADVDHLRIGEDGKLRIGRTGGLVEFQFAFMGVRFNANTRQIQSGPIVQISGDIAPLPYSAEGVPLRRSVMAIISATQELEQMRLAVSKQKTILCAGRAPIEEAWTPVDMIAATSGMILEIKPYLEMLADILPTWPSRAAQRP